MAAFKLGEPTLLMLCSVMWVTFMYHWKQHKHGGCDHLVLFLLSPLGGWPAGAFAGALAGAAGAGGGAWAGAGVWLLFVARSTSIRQVGQVCCLWNQERRQLEGGQDKKHKPFKHKVMFSLPHSLLFCLNAGPVFNADIELFVFLCRLQSLHADSDLLPQNLPGVKNVITRQFLGSSHHFFSTDDADVVWGLQIFRSSVWVSDHRQKREAEVNSVSGQRIH